MDVEGSKGQASGKDTKRREPIAPVWLDRYQRRAWLRMDGAMLSVVVGAKERKRRVWLHLGVVSTSASLFVA